MKAKVIETGEIVEVNEYPTIYQERGQGPDRREWYEDELEIIRPPKKENPADTKPHFPDGNIPYDRGFEEAQEYLSRRGFDIPWNDCDVFVDARYITQTIANVLTWADEHPNMKNTELNENVFKTNFKTGDWIVNKDGSPFSCGETAVQITNIDGKEIWLGFKTWTTAERIRMWTIKDAHDGDVLTTDTWTFIFKKYQDKSVYYHCAASTFNDFSISDTGEFDSNYVHPATKEQHDFLLKKIKEEGYVLDPERKELKDFSDEILEGNIYVCTKTHYYAGHVWEKGKKYIAVGDFELMHDSGCACFSPKGSCYNHNECFILVNNDSEIKSKRDLNEKDERMIYRIISSFSDRRDALKQQADDAQQEIDWLKDYFSELT